MWDIFAEAEKARALEKRTAFGSGQVRKNFPYNSAKDKFGNEYMLIRGAPHRGPGRYDNHTVDNFIYCLETKPESNKGYTLGARTSVRINYMKQDRTPAPGAHQPEWGAERVFKPATAPFSIKTDRFPDKALAVTYNPGPGSYNPEVAKNRKISWPMKFGRPDWSLVPSVEKKTLKSEFLYDREFLKHRNRVAYLSLYYS
nr:PREDICTED: protein pitchfork isoform X1 [Latimeria chalumnae]|eukprot:XP_014341423.1 PREDICTED: protein pitchfork isoform X1 [Latimeria chalumnae]